MCACCPAAFVIMSVSMMVTTVTLALVHERVPDRSVAPPLPDIILDHVAEEQFAWGLYSSEILIMVSTTATFLVVFFHKHR
jgi:shingomyelin synthase